MSNARITTPKGTKAEAAKAKADAKVTEAAAAIVAEGSDGLAKVRQDVRTAVGTADIKAATNRAATFVAEAEAEAFWSAIVPGRIAIGEGLWLVHEAKAKATDPNVKLAAASAVGFTAVASSYDMGTKATYEALDVTKRVGPGRRSWSALAEDFNLYAYCGDLRWRVGYEATLDIGDVPTVRGFLTFSRQAEAAEATEAEAKGTPQSRGAVTKAKAKAEAARQTKAEADAKADRITKAKAAADARITHISVHPSASVVEGFAGMSGADLTSCYDVKVLDALIETCQAWRAHVAAMSADDIKAAKAALDAPAKADDITIDAAASVAKAEAEADDEADTTEADDEAALVAKVLAAIKAAKA